MKFLTSVLLPHYPFQIEVDDKVLVMGSCFAQHMADRMEPLGSVVGNPFGVVYNPLSIALCLQMLHDGRQFAASDLSFRDSLWHSFAHHGSFSAPTADQVLSRINRESRREFDYIIVTLGTAYVYERDGVVVANCHKFPESEFTRRLVSVDECYESLERVAMLYPKARIVLTVSPIRYLRDGLSQNSLSKATLRLAVDWLVSRMPERAFYFPSFEILVDELRDYRFTTDDMCHPTPQAVEYIWDRFSASVLSDASLARLSDAVRAAKYLSHKPLHR